MKHSMFLPLALFAPLSLTIVNIGMMRARTNDMKLEQEKNRMKREPIYPATISDINLSVTLGLLRIQTSEPFIDHVCTVLERDFSGTRPTSLERNLTIVCDAYTASAQLPEWKEMVFETLERKLIQPMGHIVYNWDDEGYEYVDSYTGEATPFWEWYDKD